ncbi:MAG: hypothetical protein K0V04_34710, partial [Deltaproteobacteria bacterium]|nr:hypothetical protein [Deltaproteobacteria bacterium]
MIVSVLKALGRWVGATAIGIGLAITCTAVASASPLALAIVALLVIVIPLAIARRWPKLGSWLAVAMLVACPLALFMVLDTLSTPLISSHWGCGTPQAMLWMMTMPVMAAIVALGVGPVWRGRHWLARAWRPASIATVMLSVTVLLPASIRHLTHSPLTNGDAITARATAIEVPAVPAAAHLDATVIVDNLVIERDCTTKSCTLLVGLADQHGAPGERHPVSWQPHHDTALTVYQLDRWRIIEGQRGPHATRGPRIVFDVEEDRLVDLTIADVAPMFGPTPGPITLLLLALATVLGSLSVPPRGPLVWRRLGARL